MRLTDSIIKRSWAGVPAMAGGNQWSLQPPLWTAGKKREAEKRCWMVGCTGHTSTTLQSTNQGRFGLHMLKLVKTAKTLNPNVTDQQRTVKAGEQTMSTGQIITNAYQRLWRVQARSKLKIEQVENKWSWLNLKYFSNYIENSEAVFQIHGKIVRLNDKQTQI